MSIVKKNPTAVNAAEIEMLKRHTDRTMFLEEYVPKFKGDGDGFATLKRGYYLWSHKDEKIKKYELKVELQKEQDRVLMVPAKITNKAAAARHADPFPDIGEIGIKCHHMLAELIEIQKEQLVHLHGINSQMVAQTDLFLRLAEKKG